MYFLGKSLRSPLLFFFLFQLFIVLSCSGQSNSDRTFKDVSISSKKLSIIDTLVDSDTLYVKRDIVVIRKDSTVKKKYLRLTLKRAEVVALDTTFCINDTIVIKEDTVYSLNEKVLRELYFYSKRKSLLGRLINNVFQYKPVKKSSKPSKLVKSFEPFMSYEDKPIRSVKVVVLDAMGYSIKDTARKPGRLLEKAANLVHIKTHDWIIKNQILFKEGEKVNPFTFAETERLLRQNNYLYDARIEVEEVMGNDSVDVVLYAQDVFSLSAGASGDINTKSADVTIRDVNFLGLGQTLLYNFQFGDLYSAGTNHYLSYYINNIYRSFVSSNVYYNRFNGRESYGFHANRELVTPSLKWIGGVNLEYFSFPYGKDIRILPRHEGDTVSFKNYDFWLGHPSGLLISENKYKLGKRLVFSGRYQYLDYSKRPVISEPDKYPYYNSHLYLGNVALFSRKSYKDRYIFRFGRTEDIPEGSLLSLTGGFHHTKRASRVYTGTSYSISRYANNFGYYFLNFAIGGFFNNPKVEDGVFQAKALYFTPLLPLKSWNWRHFCGIRYAKGYNLLFSNQVQIDQERGVRGFNSNMIQGNQKLVLNYETDIFLPVNILGFQFACVAFMDLAWISYKNHFLTKDSFFPAYGLGVKIRNDHLIFNAIQILFGFYPNASKVGANSFLFFQRSNSFYTFNDFNYRRPHVITPY